MAMPSRQIAAAKSYLEKRQPVPGIIYGTDTTKSYLELMWFRDLNTFSQNLFLSKFDILQADTNLPVNTHSRNIILEHQNH